jgi:hypothetical protein
MDFTSRQLIAMLTSVAILTASVHAESTTVERGTPANGKTPYTFKVTGGAGANSYQVNIHKLTGYNNGPVYNEVDYDVVVLVAEYKTVNGMQIYKYHEKHEPTLMVTGSGNYDARFKRTAPTTAALGSHGLVP